MKLKRFYINKHFVKQFQEMDWPNSAGFVIRLMSCGMVGSLEKSISAQVEYWSDDGVWRTLACVPRTELDHDQFSEDFQEAVLKRLEKHLDWYNLRNQSLYTLESSEFASNHFEPSSDMKDIAL